MTAELLASIRQRLASARRLAARGHDTRRIESVMHWNHEARPTLLALCDDIDRLLAALEAASGDAPSAPLSDAALRGAEVRDGV